MPLAGNSNAPSSWAIRTPYRTVASNRCWFWLLHDDLSLDGLEEDEVFLRVEVFMVVYLAIFLHLRG